MPRNLLILLGVLGTVLVIVAACGASPADLDGTSPSAPTASVSASPDVSVEATAPATTEPEYEIVTLLPRDAILAIFDPEFLTAEEADAEYDDSEFVIGVEIDGEARAYSVPYLSKREIVNDMVGGRPIAVTW